MPPVSANSPLYDLSLYFHARLCWLRLHVHERPWRAPTFVSRFEKDAGLASSPFSFLPLPAVDDEAFDLTRSFLKDSDCVNQQASQ